MSSSFLIFLIVHFLTCSSSISAQSLTSFSSSNSPWLPSQNKTLVSSPNSTFTAGFLPFNPSPSSSSNPLFIFSVWYTNLPNHTTVWSANWDFPVGSSASLTITSQGELKFINSTSSSGPGPNLWPNLNSTSTSLTLKNDGNLVFGTWQSFDHPTDTILPTQPINSSTTILRSKNGNYIFSGSKDLIFNKSENNPYYSLANGLVSLRQDGNLMQDNNQPLLLLDWGQTRLRRLTLGDDGNLKAWSFDPYAKKWVVTWQAVQEVCLAHGLCGEASICYSNGSTVSDYDCMCPPGFKWRSGPNPCKRKIGLDLNDQKKSKFLRLDYVNYTSGSNVDQTYYKVRNYNECESKCMGNKRCLGFGFKYDGQGYCVLQFDKLLNGLWSPGTQAAFFLRVNSLESDPSNFTGMSELLETTCRAQISLPDPPKESHETARNITIIAILFSAEIASGVLLFWAFLKRYVKYRDMAQTLGLGLLPTAGPKRFSYAEIRAATNNFSEENVIGKGGFSEVYMGKLQDGRPVAVKCLKDVTGGESEFWAEVSIIARMHHLNLVRLWGFCNEKGQRILIYEHVPNGSLDKYLFRPQSVQSSEVSSSPMTDSENKDEMSLITPIPERKPILDLSIRYRIALGVARAIAYLHEECLEWVLHCDIKPENILLGDDFCPKVADFGLSKLRKKEQLVAMSRIRGTRGYLAPEWTKRDAITSKVDVFSFGMVLLEIVSGVRTTMVPQGNTCLASEEWYFPRWAFEMAIEERRIDQILDKNIVNSYDSKVHFNIVDRMVKTAMWCVQERPEMRPSMGKVAKMLEGTVEIIDPPKPTIFFIGETI